MLNVSGICCKNDLCKIPRFMCLGEKKNQLDYVGHFIIVLSLVII